ncbi:Hypothetical protein MVR_LOCUS269 [uncultured virus]|nr:Hypothetical protein MVR_LOCUS269 [uncultured virus]
MHIDRIVIALVIDAMLLGVIGHKPIDRSDAYLERSFDYFDDDCKVLWITIELKDVG